MKSSDSCVKHFFRFMISTTFSMCQCVREAVSRQSATTEVTHQPMTHGPQSTHVRPQSHTCPTMYHLRTCSCVIFHSAGGLYVAKSRR